MLNRIKEVLESSRADAWEITETVREGWEFYLIRGALDQNRAVHTVHIQVKVYRRSGENGEFLGSAAGEIPPTASREEITRLVDQLILAAGLVRNPAYTLRQPEPATADGV